MSGSIPRDGPSRHSQVPNPYGCGRHRTTSRRHATSRATGRLFGVAGEVGMRAEQEREFVDYIAARSAALGRTAHLLCGDWHRAEDLVQSVCVRLYSVWPRLRERDALDGYVRKMLVRAYLNERRRPWRREQAAAEAPEIAISGGYAGVETRMVLLDA